MMDIIKMKEGVFAMKKISLIVLLLLIFFVTCSIVVVGLFNPKDINVLIYGVDGREKDDTERSDAIVLVNYKFKTKQMTITSIPRDSYVKIFCKNNSYDKINHAYAYGGEACLNRTVANLFEVKTIKNIYFDFDNIVEFIDYFGLIEIIPSNSFCQISEDGKNTYCFEQNKKIQIDGKQALAYMRARKTLPNGDFDRIKNQRHIFKTLINKFINMSLLEKIQLYNYAKNIVKTDIELKNINLKEIININQIELNEYTLRGEDYIDKYYYYKLDLLYLEKIKKYYI